MMMLSSKMWEKIMSREELLQLFKMHDVVFVADL